MECVLLMDVWLPMRRLGRPVTVVTGEDRSRQAEAAAQTSVQLSGSKSQLANRRSGTIAAQCKQASRTELQSQPRLHPEAPAPLSGITRANLARDTMSAEKRPASDDPSGQLVVKRQNLGERALARANASGGSALVQSVRSRG